MRKNVVFISFVLIMFSQLSFAQTEASSFTLQKNDEAKKLLDFNNQDDFIDAKKGFIATINQDAILNPDGSVAFDIAGWDFLDADSSSTVHPGLWRQGQLNKIHGLFEVVPDKVYQIRGFDLANMTFVRTDNGWVVIDVTTSKASAKAGYDLIKKHIGDFPIKAVIFTHPHIDHYAGIDAIIEGAPNKDIEIITPKGFFEHAISESVTAGTAMKRRAYFMFGALLPKNEKGNVGTGLGQTNALGQQGIAVATTEIEKTGEKLTIDGLEMEFIFAEHTEAPCEIMIYFPLFKGFCVAEEMNRTLHNLITLRGAQVRNGKLWSKAIDDAIRLYGNDVEVSFSTHHWPTWGNKNIIPYWENQRDIYKYIHDQTLRLANEGYTPIEIAEIIELPQSLDSLFYNRGYYGTVSHNVKAQYQLYFGWFDGNPANLNTLTPTEAGKKYVEAIGGAKQVIKIATNAYKNGEYRWGAMLLNNLVFAEPYNKKARNLLADVYDQLGYQAESGPWRNFYLVGAMELRNGVSKDLPAVELSPDLFNKLDLVNLFDFIAAQLNGMRASKENLVINIEFTDIDQKVSLILNNGALTSRVDYESINPTSSIKMEKSDFIDILVKRTTLDNLIQNEKAEVDGDKTALNTLMSAIDSPNPHFNIIEP